MTNGALKKNHTFKEGGTLYRESYVLDKLCLAGTASAC